MWSINPKKLNSKFIQLKFLLLNQIRNDKIIWKKYLQLIKFLNINTNSKPVWLFFISSLLLIFSLSSYQILRLFNLLSLSPKFNNFSIIPSFLKRNSPTWNFKSKRRILSSSNTTTTPTKNKRIIYVPYKDRVLTVKLNIESNDKYERDKLIFKKFMKDHELNSYSNNNNNNNTDSQYTNAIKFQFFEKLSIIWNLILIPNFFNKNTSLLITHITLLFARTWLTLLVTKLDGQLIKDLMSFNIKYFLRDMIYWFLFAVPASYTNAGIQYLTRRISLNFRTNLVRYCHDLYMDSKLVYYKLQFNNVNDNDTNNNNTNARNNKSLEAYKLNHQLINQYITEDVKRFCESLTNLFTNVGKPMVDLVFFAMYLRDNIGNLGITGILLNYFVTGLILKNYSPNFSKLWKIRSFLESIYYNYNLNLINNCEEISFYKGIGFERLKVQEIFNNLINQLHFETNTKFIYQILEDYILKSIWPAFGYFFASLPILFNSSNNFSKIDSTNSLESIASSNIKSFTVNKRLILSMADAGSKLMYSIKDISRLSGLTDRIFTLLVNLHQVHDSNFNYGYIDLNKSKLTGGFGSTYNLSSFASKSRFRSFINNNNNNNSNSKNNLIFENGTIQYNFPGLRFEHINVIPPSINGPFNKPILKNLNFKILQGENLLIYGKNGCGKTSIIRIISELWPLFNNGLLSKPSNNDIFYVSQKQYFVSGCLRDQIIYPLNWKTCIERGDDDYKIIKVLKDVGLDYLIDRFGLNYNPNGKGSKIDEIIINDEKIELIDSYVPGNIEGKTTWNSLLSGGERQKLIFARILFHNKKFVVLDEPTSAISYDFEDILFDLLKNRGFTLITISNRENLIKYHDYILKLNHHEESDDDDDNNNDNDKIMELSDGSFSKVDEEFKRKFESLDNEIEYLENEMEKINIMKERKQELINLLDGYE